LSKSKEAVMVGVIESLVVIFASVMSLIIAIAKLQKHERSRVWDWTKRLLILLIYAAVVCNSLAGFTLFILNKGEMSRWEVVILFGHYFNLLSYSAFFVVDLGKWIAASKDPDAADTTEATKASA